MPCSPILQVAKAMKAEVGETQEEIKSAHGDMSTSTHCPLLFYNHHPFSPLGWPPIIQSSLQVQSRHGQQNAVMFPPNISSSTSGKLASSQEQENPININATRTPLYLVPYPWFFPLHDSGNGFHAQPSDNLKNKQDDISLHNGYGASSSSKTIADVDNHHFLLPIKVKNESSSLAQTRTSNDLNDILVESSDGGGGQHTGHQPRDVTLSPAPLCSIGGTFIIKHENTLQSGYTNNNAEDVSKKASHFMSALLEKKPVNYPSKKLVDAAAAAEARKRRKELKKLKNLHGRQCRMHC